MPEGGRYGKGQGDGFLSMERPAAEPQAEREALEPTHSRNIIKLQIADNHTQFGIHSKSKSF